MRGKGTYHQRKEPKRRITPAYAGKSVSLEGTAPDVHGSPPRMRGKGQIYPNLANIARITPAYAGKRSILLGNATISWDHPRVCGEKSMWKPSWEPFRGSPPRMRGKVRLLFWFHPYSRITPAYAGKSRATASPMI